MLLRHTPEKVVERTALTINPAKTCQPVGAMYAALGVSKCLPHSHGSQGCCAYHRSALTRHYKEPVMATTSSFTEGASVFGGQANILEAITNIFALLYADGTLARLVWSLDRIEVTTAIDGSGAVRHTLSATVSPSPGSAPETRSAESASASLVEAARDLVRLLFGMDFFVRVFSITGYEDGTRAYVEASREASEGAPVRVRVTERRGASSGALLVACLVDFANAEISEEASGRG